MVYLIHFKTKLHHAEHYLGFVERNLSRRIKKHKAGTGAKLLAALNRAGIAWDVVRVWPDGDRHFERKLKNRKKSRCLCPVCGAKH
ncbi:MAG: endonuclease [Williamsia sp.]|nr:endonuclease [Williamsia sp.]